MGTRKEKKEIDPEELMRRKFHAKCLFRALGRFVMENAYWLIEGVDEYEGLEDVKRRVEQAVRGKAKKKQLLSINDKALLNKNAEERTDHEKKYLYRIIGGLKCFKRYPNHVKKKLAAVTYFKYFGPGRVIVRQHHEAHALFFIVTGEVVVTQMVFDDLLQKYVSVEIGVMHPGDMFGEVSLLHNIPRTATVTTTDHCEFLQLMREDFKNVLQASVQKQWDEVLQAMSAFTYFDALDEVARREGCIVAKMKSYEVNETLLGDGVGVANFVYFILRGHCQMIESLQILVTTRLGQKYYQLCDSFVEKEDSDRSEVDFDKKYFAPYKHLQQESHTTPTVSTSLQEEAKESKEDTILDSQQEVSKTDRSSILKIPSSQKHSVDLQNIIRHSVQIKENASEYNSKRPSKVSNASTKRQSKIDFKRQSTASALSQDSLLLPPDREGFPDVRFGSIEEPLLPPNLRTYFMQVCQLNPGSSFGFGENMQDRRIVALTPVDCMLLPKIWLLQRNTANIWSRIQHYLEKKIPSKKQLFQEFVSERRWLEYREQMVNDVVSHANTVNYTSVHDVPYSIRMNEMIP